MPLTLRNIRKGVNQVMFAELPSHRKTFVGLWALGLVLLYLGIGTMAFRAIKDERSKSNRNHLMRMSPNGVEPGKTPADPFPPGNTFTEVKVGIYLEGIENLSIKESSWIATLYVWFRWQGDPALDPGKTFQLVDAKIEKKEFLESYRSDDGTNYQRFKVVAKITKYFNTMRVPLEDHMLNLYIEDGAHDSTQLRYVADSASNMSSRVKVSGYKITGRSSVVKGHTYKSSYGDPRLPHDQRTTFSQYIFAVSIKRIGFGVYIKLFIGLFAGVLLTIGSFFIRPSDVGPRFALPSAAYFGAIANAYIINSLMPTTGQFELPDYVTGVGLFTIFACFICSLVSAHFYLRRDEKDLSRALDRVSWITIGFAFAVINLLLPFTAYTGL